ncbi:MAG: hypothetical protein U9Q88_02610 [Bacillota bacterium]|nr:hypothetical protein [Bacillota bacterium]
MKFKDLSKKMQEAFSDIIKYNSVTIGTYLNDALEDTANEEIFVEVFGSSMHEMKLEAEDCAHQIKEALQKETHLN